jgi:hypothetical protein
MSERIYNKLVLYANILQKIGVINEKEKSEIFFVLVNYMKEMRKCVHFLHKCKSFILRFADNKTQKVGRRKEGRTCQNEYIINLYCTRIFCKKLVSSMTIQVYYIFVLTCSPFFPSTNFFCIGKLYERDEKMRRKEGRTCQNEYIINLYCTRIFCKKLVSSMRRKKVLFKGLFYLSYEEFHFFPSH